MTHHHDMPPAWAQLIEGLTLLAKGQSDDDSPLHCEHDTLTVMADPANFTAEELARLDELGFHASDEHEGTFTSSRYGSA